MDDLKNMIGEIVNDVTNSYRAGMGLAPINAAGQERPVNTNGVVTTGHIRSQLERSDRAGESLRVPAPAAPDHSILNLLRHCRPHLTERAVDGRGDSRAVLKWLDEEIAKAEQSEGVAIPESIK